MTDKIIFHIDVNSAFLSWSAVKQLSADPSSVDLRLVPAAVGGNIKTRHGIIAARSLPAKQYGIKTGESVVSAMGKYPKLVLVPPDMESYKKYSKAFISILHEYTDLVEQASIDEAYMDVSDILEYEQTGPESVQQAAEALADRIREDICSRLKFTVNVGISTNKLLAKMASDFTKPNRTHTLWEEEIREKMWPLPISELYGCGEKTTEKLKLYDIKTIGDAANTDLSMLQVILGKKSGFGIHQSANGCGNPNVNPKEREAKSYSNETTTKNDITQENFEQELPDIVKVLSRKVETRMQAAEVRGKTISVTVKTTDFRRHLRQTTFQIATSQQTVIYENAMNLIRELAFGSEENCGLLLEPDNGFRMIGVGLTNLEKMENHQISLDEFFGNQ